MDIFICLTSIRPGGGSTVQLILYHSQRGRVEGRWALVVLVAEDVRALLYTSTQLRRMRTGGRYDVLVFKFHDHAARSEEDAVGWARSRRSRPGRLCVLNLYQSIYREKVEWEDPVAHSRLRNRY